MEKIILTNEQEYSIKDIKQNGDELEVTLCNIADFYALKDTLTPVNLETITVHTEGGVLSTIFENYSKLTGKYSIEENEDGSINVTVYLAKENELLKRMAALEAKIQELESK